MPKPNPADNVSVNIDTLSSPLPAEITSWIMAANSLRTTPEKLPYHKLTCEIGDGTTFEVYVVPTDEDLNTVHVIDARAFVYPDKKQYFSKGYPLRENGHWCIVLCFVDRATNLVIKFKLKIYPPT